MANPVPSSPIGADKLATWKREAYELQWEPHLADPCVSIDRILALIAELESVREERDDYKACFDSMTDALQRAGHTDYGTDPAEMVVHLMDERDEARDQLRETLLNRDAQLATARAEALEEACKAVCPHCANYGTPEKRHGSYFHRHIHCLAYGIRALAPSTSAPQETR